MLFPRFWLCHASFVQVATTFDLSDQSKAPKLIAESTWNYEIWFCLRQQAAPYSDKRWKHPSLITHTSWLVYPPELWSYCFPLSREGAPWWWLISGSVDHFSTLVPWGEFSLSGGRLILWHWNLRMDEQWVWFIWLIEHMVFGGGVFFSSVWSKVWLNWTEIICLCGLYWEHTKMVDWNGWWWCW